MLPFRVSVEPLFRNFTVVLVGRLINYILVKFDEIRSKTKILPFRVPFRYCRKTLLQLSQQIDL
jgi:hypothetical protein